MDSLSVTRWQIFVDTGGTFTDAIGISPTGIIKRVKVLSSGELRELDSQGNVLRIRTGLEPPLVAAHLLTGIPLGETLPVMHMRLATTRATNALLTRTGTPSVLFVTAGFEDLHLIGTQQRPDLFAVNIIKPQPFAAQVVSVNARMSATGDVLLDLPETELRRIASSLVASGAPRTAAVALLHSSANPDHELRLAGILRECGFEYVSVASELSASVGYVQRMTTAVVDAYLSPIMETYFRGVSDALPDGSRLHVMSSAGNLIPLRRVRARDCLLSGPAAGAVGAASAALKAGFSLAIGFDMGGTSTDVCRIYNGSVPLARSQTVGDATLLSPSADLVTVAAGGGSICSLDALGTLRVGPESAGADPGPACYGLGGPLTITDVNVLLQRIDPRQFGIPLDVPAAQQALDTLIKELHHIGHQVTNKRVFCEGLLTLADDTMADAIRSVTIRQGFDLKGHALIAFGGAGGLHAARVAEKLGLTTVVVPPDAGLLSARGLTATGIASTVEVLIGEIATDEILQGHIEACTRNAMQALAVDTEGDVSEAVTEATAYLHVRGQEAIFPIDVTSTTGVMDAFRGQYERTFGVDVPISRDILCDTLVVTARDITSPHVDFSESCGVTEVALEGPFSLTLPHCAVHIPAGWSLRSNTSGALIMTQSKPSTESKFVETERQDEAVGLAIWGRRFAGIAESMGDTLQRTALSVNVRDRLDYSCAVLGIGGELVATAAHIPVHLGALGACVRALINASAFDLSDEIVVNHPAFGGSHLPDITLVTLVRTPLGYACGYVASRAHHAELGGTRPGSMPPRATTLAEEGVVISPMPYDFDRLRECLGGGRWPSRAVDDNLADLAAQRAANRAGAASLGGIAHIAGCDVLQKVQKLLSAKACKAVVRGLDRLRPNGQNPNDLPTLYGRSSIELPGGEQDEVCVALRWLPSGLVEVDFTGTGRQVSGNLNAPLAVTQAAVLYVLRLVVGDDIPLSDGLLQAVTLVVPLGTFVNPVFDVDATLSPAVVGGNTEVSQRIVDALLQALSLCAGSQGTMNNTIFGNEGFSVYETLAGGSGAGPGFHGASGVHVHMTNTRVTDPEVLERRVPVRLHTFRLLPSTGGSGKWHGGDGVERIWEFLEAVQVSLITQSRRFHPLGVAGGECGCVGSQWVTHSDGRVTVLDGIDQVDCVVGDRLSMHTPGGGGWGLAK